MNYRVEDGVMHESSYAMQYKHYIPEKISGALLVCIVGGGHRMKVWEETPDNRPGFAPLFASTGREVIIMDWATPLDSLTQSINIKLIQKIIEEEVDSTRAIVFLGWSMGGPQAFILAADRMPERTVALLGYEATGPLNFYDPEHLPEQPIHKTPKKLSPEKIEKITNSPFFPHAYKEKYLSEYLVPIPPLLEAIHTKHAGMKDRWEESTVKDPNSIPPTFLIYGSRSAEKPGLREWLQKYQKDVDVEYLENYPHLGMLCRGNEDIVHRYLHWLARRNY